MPKKTQTQLLTEHRAELDAEYLVKWPQGQFVCQRFHGFGLYWNPRRNTSHSRYRGIGTATSKRYSEEPGVYQENYQNCSFGKCTYYASLEKLVEGARRFGAPEPLIAAFVERYNNRTSEGFTA